MKNKVKFLTLAIVLGAVFAFANYASAQTFENPLTFDSVDGVVGSLLDNLRGIIAGIAVVFIVVGGVMYILSAGDETKMKTAKATITAAVIGFAIALAAPTFLKELRTILGAKDSSTVDSALTLNDIVTNVLNLLLSVVGILGIIGLIIGGAFYLTSYGDEDRMKTGKSIITASIIGIVVAMAALVIVGQVSTLIGN